MSIEFSSDPKPNPEQPHGEGTLESNNTGNTETSTGEEYKDRLTLDHFLSLAEQEKWEQFDADVLLICNDPKWLGWAIDGITDSAINTRDLAISILEKTTSELEAAYWHSLDHAMLTDENMHLRRKAAIALCVKGDRSPAILAQIAEAAANDPELKEQALELLGRA